MNTGIQTMLEYKLCWNANHAGKQTMLENKPCWNTNHVGIQTMLEYNHAGIPVECESCWITSEIKVMLEYHRNITT